MYHKNSEKIAQFIKAGTFQIVDESKSQFVFSSEVTQSMYSDFINADLYYGDFSELIEPGNYLLEFTCIICHFTFCKMNKSEKPVFI
ncbi:cellulase N-terminal Ig-like domain-containing protein [Lederbergia wuyishanensis]|uniref:cellulase N-terminal Ig-like domain-containing protein n=1 Tax=Lederbergia wuyishanensis TaxID=1347903 RepID=UPI003521F271